MTQPDRPTLMDRVLERRVSHRRRSRLYRIAFGIGGGLVLLAGVIMLVTPGPAFVLIPIGLAMLALEFTWAERLLEPVLRWAEQGRAAAARTSRTQQGLGALAFVAIVAVAAYLAFKYVL